MNSPLALLAGAATSVALTAIGCGNSAAAIGMNEAATIGTLRALTTAQEQFKMQVRVDGDKDEMGEYGWLAELAGSANVRGAGKSVKDAPFIAPEVGTRAASGHFERNGYRFLMYLPNADGTCTAEPKKIPSSASKANAEPREYRWTCYAWPIEAGVTGNRTFMADYSGDVWATDGAKRRYSGGTKPKGGAAYPGKPAKAEALQGPVDGNGSDGNSWGPAGS